MHGLYEHFGRGLPYNQSNGFLLFEPLVNVCWWKTCGCPTASQPLMNHLYIMHVLISIFLQSLLPEHNRCIYAIFVVGINLWNLLMGSQSIDHSEALSLSLWS